MRKRLNTKKNSMLRNLLLCINKDLFVIDNYMQDEEYSFSEIDYFIMALEDRRFIKHNGINIFSVFREILKMILRKKHGGASTIDMQMVRTITNYRELTLKRKLYEMLLAYLINRRFTKEQIMKCYVENAFFGTGLIGIKNTVKQVYNKDKEVLSSYENARIAAMLLKPRPKNAGPAWELAVHTRAIYAQQVRRFVKNR